MCFSYNICTCVVVVVFRFFFWGWKPYPKRQKRHFFDDGVCKLGMFHWRSKPWEVEGMKLCLFFVFENGVRIFKVIYPPNISGT